jgi:hypothetical protein
MGSVSKSEPESEALGVDFQCVAASHELQRWPGFSARRLGFGGAGRGGAGPGPWSLPARRCKFSLLLHHT